MDVDGFGTLLQDYGSDMGATLDDLLPSLCSSTVLPDLSSPYTGSPPLAASTSMHTPARYVLTDLDTPVGSGVTADGAAVDGTSTLATSAGVDGDACRTAGGLPEDFTLPMSLLASPMTEASASPFALSRDEDPGILASLLDDAARQPSSFYYADPAAPFEGLGASPLAVHLPPPRVPARLSTGPPAADEAATAYRPEVDSMLSAAAATSAAAISAAAATAAATVTVTASPSPLLSRSAPRPTPVSTLKIPHSSAAAVCLAPPRRTAPPPARRSSKGRSARPVSGGRRLKSSPPSPSSPRPSKRRSLPKAACAPTPSSPAATVPAALTGPSARVAAPRKRAPPVKRTLFAAPPLQTTSA